MIRDKLSEAGIPIGDREANLHVLQFLAFEYEVDENLLTERPEPDSQHGRGPGAYNIPGFASEQEAGGRWLSRGLGRFRWGWIGWKGESFHPRPLRGRRR